MNEVEALNDLAEDDMLSVELIVEVRCKCKGRRRDKGIFSVSVGGRRMAVRNAHAGLRRW
jgi:hypothetical protein